MEKRLPRRLLGENGLLAAILVVALAVRLIGIQFGKPFRYHPDEIKLVVQAGRLLEPEGRSADALFGLGSYPPLYTYLLAGVYAAYGLAGVALGLFGNVAAFKESYYLNTFAFHLIGRGMTALLGAATVLVLYHVGAKAYNRRVGLLAAAFCATVFLHARNSHYLTVDVPATFMATAVFLAAVAVYRRGGWKEIVVGGLLSGLTAATKYNAGLILVPFLVAVFLRAKDERGRATSAFIDARLYLAVACAGLGFLLGCPLVVIDPQRFLQGFLTYGNLQAQGKVGVGGGFFAYLTGQMSPGYGVFSHNSIPSAMGPVLAALGVIGLMWLARRRTRADWLGLSFIVPYYVVIGLANYKTMRQFLPLVPFWLLAASTLLDAAVTKVQRRRVLASLALALFVAGAVVPELYKDVRWAVIMRGPDPRTDAKEWIEEHLSDGTAIALEKYGPPLLDQRDPHAQLRLRSGQYRRAYQLMDSQAQLSFGYRGEPEALVPIQEYLAARGAEYFISDSFTRDSFYLKLSVKAFPRLAAHRRAFYAWLDAEAEQVAMFAPQHNWAALLPTLMVYRLPWSQGRDQGATAHAAPGEQKLLAR